MSTHIIVGKGLKSSYMLGETRYVNVRTQRDATVAALTMYEHYDIMPYISYTDAWKVANGYTVGSLEPVEDLYDYKSDWATE